MHIKRQDLDSAVKKKLLTSKQADALWKFWQVQQQDIPSFKLTHVLYYLGGMIAISAVTIYVTNAWNKLQGFPLLMLSIFLFLLGLWLTHYFLQKKLRIPAGILATFSLALVPFMVYNLQFLLGMTPPKNYHYSDFHYWIDWYWLNMEIATILVGAIMFYFYRFSFLLFPIAVVLWYMSMDLWPWLANFNEYDLTGRARFSMCFGLLILIFAVYMDFKFENERQDYAFWLYIVGVLTCWGGLSAQDSDSEVSKFFYFLINVAMLFIGAILNRRVFAVFGVLGILAYLGHLAFQVFEDSLGFPIVLIIIGLLIIFAAAFFTRVEKKINKFMLPFIPKKIADRMK